MKDINVAIVLLIKILLLTVMCIIIFFFSIIACANWKYQIPLKQDTENIIKIELLDNTDENNPILYDLEADKMDDFIAELVDIEFKKCTPPLGYYGDLIIYLYYDNGDVDIIGSETTGYIISGKEILQGLYYPDPDDIEELFDKYID